MKQPMNYGGQYGAPAPIYNPDTITLTSPQSCPDCPDCPSMDSAYPSPNNNNIVLSPSGSGARSLTLGGTMISPTYILMVIGFLAFLTGLMISKKK